MPVNIEIKAFARKPDEIKRIAAELSGTQGTLIRQQDTFFNLPVGRLKLRVLDDEPSLLIFYKRSDVAGPKQSDFSMATVTEPQELMSVLGEALGIKGVVKKERLLFLVGQTRIHVDVVENLGNFMELEVLLKDGQTFEDGKAIAEDLMKKLGVESSDLVEGAYMDLLTAKA